MRPVPVFGPEMAAARAADLIADGGGPRRRRRPRPSRRALEGRRLALGSRLVAAGLRAPGTWAEVR
jgi:hypothetical protein